MRGSGVQGQSVGGGQGKCLSACHAEKEWLGKGLFWCGQRWRGVWSERHAWGETIKKFIYALNFHGNVGDVDGLVLSCYDNIHSNLQKAITKPQ